GVSMGVYDFTKTAFKDLGAEIFFERVALRPGKPTVFGRVGQTLIFGLPGNPVSVSVTFSLFVRAALRAMHGATQTSLPKETARLAGVMAAKRTAELIPLCHPLPLTHVDVRAEIKDDGVYLEAEVSTKAHTGVEMEALTAVSVAALTVYDMCKALDKSMTIT